jgi:hypothetical protein
MRRPFMGAVIAAITFSALVSGSALAGYVENHRGSNLVAQVVWGTGDPETGIGTFGGIAAVVEEYGTSIFLWEDIATPITCDAGTPEDPTDDYQALSHTFRTGEGPATVVIARNLGSAVAEGTLLEASTWQVDDCTGEQTLIASEQDVPVSLSLVATGRPEPWADQFHDKLAGELNVVEITRSMSRAADGTVSLAGEPQAFDAGLISRNSWNGHFGAR